MAPDGTLSAVAATPVSTWNYLAEGRQVRHLGPVAEDFHTMFGLGPSDHSIPLSDMDGVNFAAIQALERRTAEQAQRIQTLEERLARLEALLAAAQANGTMAPQPPAK